MLMLAFWRSFDDTSNINALTDYFACQGEDEPEGEPVSQQDALDGLRVQLELKTAVYQIAGILLEKMANALDNGPAPTVVVEVDLYSSEFETRLRYSPYYWLVDPSRNEINNKPIEKVREEIETTLYTLPFLEDTSVSINPENGAFVYTIPLPSSEE